jgi:hypothetical protein
VTAISQQKWTSPLGSAFAAVQPQVAAQTSLSNAGSVGTSPNSGGPQTSNAPMFYAPAGPSQSQIQQNQQQIQVVINDKITVGPPISIKKNTEFNLHKFS